MDFIENSETLMKDPEKPWLINSVNINVVSQVLDDMDIFGLCFRRYFVNNVHFG